MTLEIYKKNVKINFYLNDKLYKKIINLAKKNKTNMSVTIRQILEERLFPDNLKSVHKEFVDKAFGDKQT